MKRNRMADQTYPLPSLSPFPLLPFQLKNPTHKAVPHRSVIVKLLGFTAAMVILPIGSYFVTVNTIFRGAS